MTQKPHCGWINRLAFFLVLATWFFACGGLSAQEESSEFELPPLIAGPPACAGQPKRPRVAPKKTPLPAPPATRPSPPTTPDPLQRQYPPPLSSRQDSGSPSLGED